MQFSPPRADIVVLCLIRLYASCVAENKYPEDEFDILARDRVSHGTHRKVEAASRWWIKALIVCAVAVALGLGLSFAYARFIAPKADVSTTQPAADEQSSEDSGAAADDAATDDPSPSGDASAQPSETPSDAAISATPEATTPSAQATQTQEPAPAAVKSTSVRVLNASKATGLAAKKKQVLTSAGYTAVQVGNTGKQSARHTTVYYANPDLKATAEDVAATLGIAASNVVENANAAGEGITVVLLGEI